MEERIVHGPAPVPREERVGEGSSLRHAPEEGVQKRDADRGAHEKARERAVHAAGAAPASALRRGLVSEVRGPPRRRSVGRALLGRPN